MGTFLSFASLWGRKAERRDSSTAGVDAVPPQYAALVPSGFYANPAVTPERAVSVLGVAARCISLISEGLAALPLTMYVRQSDGSLRETDHGLARLLNEQPNDWQSSFELREALVRDVATYGNGLLLPVRDGRGGVAELRHLPYRFVSIERLINGRLRYRFSEPHSNAQAVYLQDEIIHFRFATRDGLIGIGPLEWSRRAVGLAVAQALLAEKAADSGFLPPLSFEMDGAFGTSEQSETAWRRLKTQLREAVRGMIDGNALLLEGGLKAKPLSAPMRDQEFFVLRQMSLEEVARCFGIPVSVLGLGKNTSYGSLTEESRSLRQNVFSPWARRIENTLSCGLMSPEQRRTLVLAHDLSGLDRGDLGARMTAWKAAVEAGIFTIEEIRRWEGVPSQCAAQS